MKNESHFKYHVVIYILTIIIAFLLHPADYEKLFQLVDFIANIISIINSISKIV